ELDDALVGLSRADDAAMRPDGNPWRCRLRPLPFFDDLRVRLVNDVAHFGERLPAPVSKFFDSVIDGCRGRFHGNGFFHMWLQLSNQSRSLEPKTATSRSMSHSNVLATVKEVQE